MPNVLDGLAVIPPLSIKATCVFCGKTHDEPKKDEIKPTKWKRKTISGVGGNFVSSKKSLYPGNTAPPSTYRSEGHHCLAFSAFIVDARTNPTDRFPVLNHYLKEKGYDPNNENNRIDLPGRKKRGDSDEHAHYKEYEKAVLAKKPLQLHIGGHTNEFLMLSNMMLQDVINSSKRKKLCEKPDDEFKKKLKEKLIKKEDQAFKKTASASSGWVAHPGPLEKAENYVKEKHGISKINYPKI